MKTFESQCSLHGPALLEHMPRSTDSQKKFFICEGSLSIWLLFMSPHATQIAFLSSVLEFMLQSLITIL